MTVIESQPAEVGGNPAERTYEQGVGQLAAALAAVQAELPYVSKTEDADIGSYQYKYADLSAVSAAIMPLLGLHGLAFTAWPTLTDQGKLVLRYHLVHKSGQSMTGEYPIGGGNAQAIGSAITYARRYALCAVTGIAPGDDDDAAAAVGAREVERDEQRADQAAEQDRDRQLGLEAVKGAWFNQYGEWNGTAAADMFEKWSHGATVGEANPKQLRAFAGYLHALPAADAGSTPEGTATPAQGPQEAPSDRPLSGAQRGKVFALFEDLGMRNDRPRQLEYLTSVLGRTIKSRGDVLMSDADTVITALEADFDEARRTGLAPQTAAPGPPADIPPVPPADPANPFRPGGDG